jgi:hypothetical protein
MVVIFDIISKILYQVRVRVTVSEQTNFQFPPGGIVMYFMGWFPAMGTSSGKKTATLR